MTVNEFMNLCDEFYIDLYEDHIWYDTIICYDAKQQLDWKVTSIGHRHGTIFITAEKIK